MAAAPYASWGSRAGAWLIDLVIIIGIFLLFTVLGLLGRRGVFVLFGMFGLVSLVYKPLMEGAWGQTLGKMAVGIKVVRAGDAGPIGYGEAFIRWLVAAVIGWIPLGAVVNLLWPLWDQYRQTLHDKAAKTIVVTV